MNTKFYLLFKKEIKKNHLLKYKISVFTILILGFQVFAQIPNNKLDRKFKLLLNNKESVINKRIDAAKTFKLDIKSSNIDDKIEKYSCIIYTKDADLLKKQGIEVQSVYPTFVTAFVTVDQLEQLVKMSEVTYIASPEFSQVNNDVAVASSGASLLHSGKLNNTPYKGNGILVGIYDTGIDWKHPDFRNETDQTKSRIVRIWDQTLTPTGAETSPSGFTYGVEYTQAHINDELDGTPANFVRENDTHGHGTHVSGTAAGNGMAFPLTRKHSGLAPESEIIFVKGGNSTFSSTNTINAFTYFKNVANELGRPIVVNMSIGGQFGPHDGTLPEEIAADSFTNSAPGRVVVISAGNDNNTNIHKRNVIPAGGSATINFVVPSNTTATDIFYYQFYANDNSTITVSSKAPSGEILTATTGQELTLNVTNNNLIQYLGNIIDVGIGDSSGYLVLTRNGTNTQDCAGTWDLTITNNGTNPITVDGWLYYKGPSVNTTVTGGDSNFLVGSPGCASNAITTASYVGRLSWFSNSTSTPGGYSYTGSATQDNISTFSSIGPRRDGVQKPNISASGQAVISCLSTGTLVATSNDNVDGTYYRKNQGTSMAAPVVAGAVALLLQAQPTATYLDIRNAIHSNATADVSTGSLPNVIWGYGKLDVFNTASSMLGLTLKRKTYNYESPYTSTTTGAGSSYTTTQLAVRFTPDVTGKLGGIYFHTSTTASFTTLKIEVRENNGGNPGNLLGSYDVSPTSVNKFTWNYYDLSNLNVPVTNGVDYFLILVPGSGSAWSLRSETSNIDNRSYSSPDGITWTLNTTGDYRIRSVVYEITTTLSAEDINKKSNTVQIFPNPATDVIYVKNSEKNIQKVSLYDMSGKILKINLDTNDEIKLDLNDIPKGIYVLKIEFENETISRQIIKK